MLRCWQFVIAAIVFASCACIPLDAVEVKEADSGLGKSERLFRAGAAAIDITPPEFPVTVNGLYHARTATGFEDRLYARSMVLDDGTQRIALVVVDSCMIGRDLLDNAKKIATDTTGIPSDHILISATHSHSTPSVCYCLSVQPDPNYSAFLPDRIAASIEQAVANLSPAKIGWTSIRADAFTGCRRPLGRPDQRLDLRYRPNPFGERDWANTHWPRKVWDGEPGMGPSGPVNDQLSIVSVQSIQGRPVAVLANFGFHFNTTDHGDKVSADGCGLFTRELSQRMQDKGSGPPFVGMMSQGTSGDQKGDITVELVEQVYEKIKEIEYHDWALLDMREKLLKLNVRRPDKKRLEWAKKIVAELKGAPPGTYREVHAMDQLLLEANPERETKLQAIRIGGLGIAAIPCEVFGITGLKIGAQSPFESTFTIALANGADGYIPPPEQHKLGGYTTLEAMTACLEEEAEPKIVEAVVEMFEELSARPRQRGIEPNGEYADAILVSKPVIYWRLGELNGPVAIDSSENKNHGKYCGYIAFGFNGPQSAGFSGQTAVNRSVHLIKGSITGDITKLRNDYSVEMWACVTIPVGRRAVTGCLFSRIADSRECLLIGGKDLGPNRLVFRTGEQSLVGKTELQMNRWYNIIMTRDAGSVSVYLNGNRTPEIASESAEVSAGCREIFIGGCGDGKWDFAGKIDEVSVYDRTLTVEETGRHYAAYEKGIRR